MAHPQAFPATTRHVGECSPKGHEVAEGFTIARAENRRSLEAVPTSIHVGSLRPLDTLSAYRHCWRCRARSCLEAECGEQREPAEQEGVKGLLGCVSPRI
jgi:hypothetical protein